MVNDIKNLINFFFIKFIINIFINLYLIYYFFDFKIFQKKQGLKLNIKKYTMGIERKDKR